MASTMDGHRGQTSPKQRAHIVSDGRLDGPVAPSKAAPQTSAARLVQDRRQRNSSLAIGAPLTAAFIGGFLVIENSLGADLPEEADLEVLPDDQLMVDSQSEGGEEQGLQQGASAGFGPGAVEGSGNAEDPAAAPGENASVNVDAAAIGAAAVATATTAAVSSLPMADGSEGGTSEANLNFFDINIGTGEFDAETDAPVIDDVLVRDRQVGTPGDDVLTGSDGDDAISGAAGDDIIHGHGGRDVLNGNEGDDQLFGGAGSDRLDGGAGNDRLEGGDDNDLDLLKGGLGDDIIFIESPLDVALERDFGAYANDQDTVVVRSGYADGLAPFGEDHSTFVFADNLGADLPAGASGYRQLVSDGIEHVRLEGTVDHDIFADDLDNQLTGNAGANVIDAGGGDDQVFGGAGDDRLVGGDGDDEIFGGLGDDVIEGGLGEDMLYGEGGDDMYLFGLADNAIDTVFDHEGANRVKIEGVTDESVQASLLDNDLYVTVDDKPVAKVSDYVGHEDSIAGIDFGQGVQSVDALLTEQQDLRSAVEEIEAGASDEDDFLLTHEHLVEPTIVGDLRSDQRLDGTDGDDWLSGFDGKDVLFGHDGDDILAGGDGSDRLEGGAGDDRYLFEKGESGIDKIDDVEGRNMAELKGYDRAKIEGAMLGDDLAVLADGDVLFTVEDFSANQGAFEGVQAGNRFVQTEDLLT